MNIGVTQPEDICHSYDKCGHICLIGLNNWHPLQIFLPNVFAILYLTLYIKTLTAGGILRDGMGTNFKLGLVWNCE